MGQKKKVGKQRKDKFYHLAKETGYRSRAAFKLIQLNRRFEFLQRSRVLVDLCAAPGGWLQVAHKFMPVSSVIIGVDLVPIKPIGNVITLQEDITTLNCRQALKKELKTWKADVFLHDGAPNVGKSWLHDAFEQARLTLMALKLATEFLVKGGWFVTKVFRSKDYHALLWVFNKLFKKVHATKPQASRNESAEIFVVCQHYLAPDKIDPKFLDSSHLFKEVEVASKAKLNLLKPEKAKKKAEGYDEGDYTLYHKLMASDFINSTNHMELLGKHNEIVLDTEAIESHPLTTTEIVECCKDLKVLGRKELKNLLTWRKKLKESFEPETSAKTKEQDGSKDKELTEEMEEDAELDSLDKLDNEIKLEKIQQLKRKKKKVLKEKRKLRDKLNLQMVIKNDKLVEEDDPDLFRLGRLQTKAGLEHSEADVAILDDDPDKPPAEDDESEDEGVRRSKWVPYDRDEKHYDLGKFGDAEEDEASDAESSSSIGESLQFESSDEQDADEVDEVNEDSEEKEKNPLLVDLVPEPSEADKASMWFQKAGLSEMNDDIDEDLELELMADHLERKKKDTKKGSKNEHPGSKKPSDSAEEEEDVTSEEEYVDYSEKENGPTVASGQKGYAVSDVTEEAKPAEKQATETKAKKRVRLDPEGLALGSILIQSKKKKRDIVEAAYNRFTFNDENLPKWFVEDEKKHYRKNVPVTKEMIQEYKQRLKEIDARPIKKIAEAKARKKKRALKRMEKARKKAEAITDAVDMSEKEKAEHIRAIYKKALKTVNKKKDVTVVVAKKGLAGKKGRPAGVKGKFKMVDPRMKKDKRKQQAQEKSKKGGRGGKRKK